MMIVKWELNDKTEVKMAQIDRGSKTPLYIQIYNDLNDRIKSGDYAPGSMLDSENKLCTIYGVERATVRRALGMMVEEGTITRIPGLGTSVTDPTQSNGCDERRNLLFLLPKGFDNSDRIREPFNAKVMSMVEHECTERGYTLLYKSFSQTDTVDDLIKTCDPCGVFYTSSLTIEMYKMFKLRGIPVVFLNQNYTQYPSVCLDNRGGVRMLMEYLIDMGHRKIGFISGIPEGQNQISRFNGYKETLIANDIGYNPNWVVDGAWTIESGKKAIRELLSKDDRPSAVFAANDSMAIGAMMEAASMGYSIPDDISVVGFDNIDQASYVTPSLTTAAVDYVAMARAACMLLFDMIEHDNAELNVNIYIPLKVIARESVCKVG